MKVSTIQCRVTIVTVVYLLTSVLAVGKHKEYLRKNHKVLRNSQDHWELFGELNLYWNYLSFGLLDGLLDELIEENADFIRIREVMDRYREDMQMFKELTTLALFCQVQTDMLSSDPLVEADPPPGFQKIVTEHQWPESVTLKDVEEFRQRFLSTFGLPKTAMMVYRIRRRCFEVTWFATLPASVTVLLNKRKGSHRL